MMDVFFAHTLCVWIFADLSRKFISISSAVIKSLFSLCPLFPFALYRLFLLSRWKLLYWKSIYRYREPEKGVCCFFLNYQWSNFFITLKTLIKYISVLNIEPETSKNLSKFMKDGWLCYQKYLIWEKQKKKDYVWCKYCVHADPPSFQKPIN